MAEGMLPMAGTTLVAGGMVEAVVADAYHDAVADLAAEGVSQVANVGEELGEAKAAGELADVMEDVASEE